VQRTIAEIAVDLLGAEAFALLLRTSGGAECQIPLFQGEEGSLFARGTYRGGDPQVDATLSDGLLRIGRQPGSTALAVVPLRVQEAVVGALVLLKLFDHKPALSSQDRDLLDLLAAHAASALLAARTASATERRLQTLESLLELLRGET
jgi:GAF domain-containing protein